jgi:hypothetical protein
LDRWNAAPANSSIPDVPVALGPCLIMSCAPCGIKGH